MTSDEARKLVGGYATGSLTEAERAALFRAALEDQELFDELAGEQVLKEVLDEPGARQRLIAALEPPRHRAWLWLAAAATAGLAIVVGVVVSQRTPPPPPQGDRPGDEIAGAGCGTGAALPQHRRSPSACLLNERLHPFRSLRRHHHRHRRLRS